MFRHAARFAALACAVLTPYSASAEDWPQWLGPKRDGVWNESGVATKFPAGGPKILWRQKVSHGYSGPAVSGDKVFVTDYLTTGAAPEPMPQTRDKLQGKERILCFNAKTGEPLWKHEYDCAYEVSYPNGPRCTPTVDGDRVYTLGAEGNLVCLNVADGQVVWSKDLKKAYSAPTPLWGFSGHPLVDGNKLICLVGGEGSVAVAFDKATGKELWKALSAPEPGYAPPTIITSGGKRQVVIWHSKAVNSLDPETGAVYWTQPLEPSYGMAIAAPIQVGDQLFATAYQETAALFKLASNEPAASVVWKGDRDTAIYCANSTPIIDEGVVYGVDARKGDLRAVSLKDGKVLWSKFMATADDRRAAHGTAFLAKNGDHYFLLCETGDLVIAKLTPESYTELARAKLVEPTSSAFGRPVVWSCPAYAHKCIFARNDEEIVCASLAAE
ncbi:MAG TPA: PQQ-binding-like beta-propeller repeat protein [Pirellulales bacterium]